MGSEKRVAVFIDGNNFYFGLRKIYGKDKSLKNFDFKQFSQFLAGTNKVYYIIKEDDINMAVDMVENAYEDNYDTAVLVSGDGDFIPAVRSVRKKNKLVKNVYFKNSSSRNLKNFCDESLELTKDNLNGFFKK